MACFAQRPLIAWRIKANIWHRKCWFCRVLVIMGRFTISQASVWAVLLSRSWWGFLERPSRHWHLSGSGDFSSKEMFLTIFKNYGMGCFWRRSSAGVDLSFFVLFCYNVTWRAFFKGWTSYIRVMLVSCTRADCGVCPSEPPALWSRAGKGQWEGERHHEPEKFAIPSMALQESFGQFPFLRTVALRDHE